MQVNTMPFSHVIFTASRTVPPMGPCLVDLLFGTTDQLPGKCLVLTNVLLTNYRHILINYMDLEL